MIIRKIDVGKRLRHLRFAYGGASPTAWAEETGINIATWYSWEEGRRLIPPSAALDLARDFGITLDWVYGGHLAGVKSSALGRLASLPPKQIPAKRAHNRMEAA